MDKVSHLVVQTKSSEQVVSSRYFLPIFDNLEIQFLQFVNITLSETTTENVRKVILKTSIILLTGFLVRHPVKMFSLLNSSSR